MKIVLQICAPHEISLVSSHRSEQDECDMHQARRQKFIQYFALMFKVKKPLACIFCSNDNTIKMQCRAESEEEGVGEVLKKPQCGHPPKSADVSGRFCKGISEYPV
jgi:hypothetical protein